MRGQSVLNLSHDPIAGVVINRFYEESNRLFDEAQERFGVMAVASPVKGCLDLETDSPEVAHNHARYRAVGGQVIDIVKGDTAIGGAEVDPRALKIQTVVRTALPNAPGWPNAYIKESFTFDDRLEFAYELDTSDYTSEGQEIISDRDGSGLAFRIAELLRDDPGGEGETFEEIEMRNELRAIYGRAREPRLRALRVDFPEEMKSYGIKCTDVHFNNILKVIREVEPDNEVGLRLNPFIRFD
jgi:hypothetical protein